MVAVRVVIITVLVTIVTGALGLLLGIVGFALTDAARGGGVNMAHAYREVALPVATVALVVSLALSARNELKVYLRERAAARNYPRAA